MATATGVQEEAMSVLLRGHASCCGWGFSELRMFGLCCAYGMIMFSDDFHKQHGALGLPSPRAAADWSRPSATSVHVKASVKSEIRHKPGVKMNLSTALIMGLLVACCSKAGALASIQYSY